MDGWMNGRTGGWASEGRGLGCWEVWKWRVRKLGNGSDGILLEGVK